MADKELFEVAQVELQVRISKKDVIELGICESGSESGAIAQIFSVRNYEPVSKEFIFRDRCGPIGGTVVDHDDFIFLYDRIAGESIAEFSDRFPDILFFVQGGHECRESEAVRHAVMIVEGRAKSKISV